MYWFSVIPCLLITVFVTTYGEVVDRSPDNALGFGLPIVICYYKYSSGLSPKMTTYWRNRMQAVSEDHKDITFATSDSDLFNDKLIDFGFQFDWKRRLDSDPIVVAEDKNLKRFLLDEKLTTESLQRFVHKFKTNQLEPHIRSEAIPDNTGRAVKEVVGKTFTEMVINNPKDVFIMMYAYWCGHCKEALPIWEEFGERMVNETDVDILQIELTRNEVHKPWKTMSYPTIWWLTEDKYSPEKYLGKRTVRQFIEFVSSKSTQPLLKYDRKGKLRKEMTPKEKDSKVKASEERPQMAVKTEL